MSSLYDAKGKYTAIAFKLGQVEYIKRDDYAPKSDTLELTTNEFGLYLKEGGGTYQGGGIHV